MARISIPEDEQDCGIRLSFKELYILGMAHSLANAVHNRHLGVLRLTGPLYDQAIREFGIEEAKQLTYLIGEVMATDPNTIVMDIDKGESRSERAIRNSEDITVEDILDEHEKMVNQMEQWSNEQIAAIILPWAKEHRNDAYEKTLKVASQPTAFRRYLLRLVELRCEAEPEWRNTEVPVLVLDETSLSVTAQTKDGTKMVFKGRAASGEIENRIFELGLNKQEFATLQAAKKELDLYYVSDNEQQPRNEESK